MGQPHRGITFVARRVRAICHRLLLAENDKQMDPLLVIALPSIDGLVPRVLRRALHHRYFRGLGLRRSVILVLESLGSQTPGE